MLIATFGSSTAWVGRTITFENEQFVLEGHGPIRVHDVLGYVEQGHLGWASPGARDFVHLRARDDQAPRRWAEASIAPGERVPESFLTLSHTGSAAPETDLVQTQEGEQPHASEPDSATGNTVSWGLGFSCVGLLLTVLPMPVSYSTIIGLVCSAMGVTMSIIGLLAHGMEGPRGNAIAGLVTGLIPFGLVFGLSFLFRS